MYKKPMQNKSKLTSQSNANTKTFNIQPYMIKIYFPTISLHKIQEVIKYNSKTPQTSKISQYLVNEKSKSVIYGSTGIFEVLNDNIYQLYPIDKPVTEINIRKESNNGLHILIDSSYMKRADTPSFQIPYIHNIKEKTINTYKNDNTSNLKFIIEFENDVVSDFYAVITSNEISKNEKNEIEINKFVKDELLSFLSRLNLYR
uniref:Uncharacterized protein n=1 Tax=viral metagenome TaxID=1070528 RepID=A0A6C0EW45_9ZZZZ